jgi:inner membrane protein
VPTVITHAALPLITAWGLGRRRVPARLAMAGALLAIVPDLDLLGRLAHIDHHAPLGHRGISHALAFSLILALLATFTADWQIRRWPAFLFLFASAASHGLADMLTTGGKGIMLWWPLTSTRFRFLFHPVEVSPILLRGLEDGRLAQVLLSELLWLVLPALLFAMLMRRLTAEYIDSAQGGT